MCHFLVPQTRERKAASAHLTKNVCCRTRGSCGTKSWCHWGCCHGDRRQNHWTMLLLWCGAWCGVKKILATFSQNTPSGKRQSVQTDFLVAGKADVGFCYTSCVWAGGTLFLHHKIHLLLVALMWSKLYHIIIVKWNQLWTMPQLHLPANSSQTQPRQGWLWCG